MGVLQTSSDLQAILAPVAVPFSSTKSSEPELLAPGALFQFAFEITPPLSDDPIGVAFPTKSTLIVPVGAVGRVNVNAFEADAPLASFTVTEKLRFFGADCGGVPLSTPELLIVKYGGNPEALQVSGSWPPIARKFSVTSCCAIKAGSKAGMAMVMGFVKLVRILLVIFSAAGFEKLGWSAGAL